MKKDKILIIDDHEETVDRWCSELKKIGDIDERFEITPLKSEAFKEALSIIEERRKKARTSGENFVEFEDLESCILDEAEIMVVDYDLLDFDNIEDEENDDSISDKKNNIAGVSTGERVAYLARAYSRCGLIVALNQFGDNPFDLKLKGNPDSYADINLGSRQLDNPNLWKKGLPEEFCPWSWFVLPNAAKAFNNRWKKLLEPSIEDENVFTLDTPILAHLKFPENVVKYIPRSIAEFLGSSDLSGLTFRNFVLKSEQGLDRKDNALNEESIARIAAARISKWLERLVLPGQEVLVDAPHLISRFSSLLNGEPNDIELWNRTASRGEDTIPISQEFLKEFSFDSDWLSRPAWFWSKIKNNENIAEIANPFEAYEKLADTDWVFCEDISKFLPSEATKEFVADLPSPFVRRFVVNTETKIGKEYQEVLKNVEYIPSVRFML